MDIEIRQMVIKDVIPLMSILLSPSEEDRKFFHLHHFKVWKLLPLLFCISISKKVPKCFRKLFPKLAFLSLVVVNAQKQITGFAYLEFLNKLADGSYIARLNYIIVFGGYRNMGIGSRLMDKLISLAYINNIRKITLTVVAENKSAIDLYQKFRFSIKSYEMECTLENVIENSHYDEVAKKA